MVTYSGIPALLYSGAIQITISPDGLTLTNQTLPTHVFHNGMVVRNYSQREDGAWVVTTVGTGTNVWPVVGPTVDQANDVVGPAVFTAIDAQMRIHITQDQMMSGAFPRWEVPLWLR